MTKLTLKYECFETLLTKTREKLVFSNTILTTGNA